MGSNFIKAEKVETDSVPTTGLSITAENGFVRHEPTYRMSSGASDQSANLANAEITYDQSS